MPGEKGALIKHAPPLPLYVTPCEGQLRKAPLWISTVHYQLENQKLVLKGINERDIAAWEHGF